MPHVIRWLAALPILLALAPSPLDLDMFTRDQVSGQLGTQLDSQLTRFAEYGFSGTVLVVRDGRVVLLKGYGQANVETGIRNTAATRFEMNSMTKMFTGVAILQLAAQGRLRLSDPAARYLDGFLPGKQGATIEQLATHTSGLIPEGIDLAGNSRDAFVRDVGRTPVESAPGDRYRYSNAGFSLLAAIIETVSGETYEQYVRRHLFAPAGMQTAKFRDEVAFDDPLFAHGYVGTPAALEPGPPNPYAWGTRGAGGVWATVGDMYRWLVAVEERRVLSEAQWRVLMAPPHPPAQEAFGWHVETAPDGRPRIQKGGGSDDFASHLLYYPRERLAIIWASNNLRQRWRQTLNQAIPARLLANTPVSLPPVAAVPGETIDAHGGRYRSSGNTFELRAGPGYLYVTPNRLDIPTHVMFFPQDADHFTAFDPQRRAVMRLEFSGTGRQLLAFTLEGERRVSAQRATADP
jgi:CubicO group peptidase (beta-lactamase class C family)